MKFIHQVTSTEFKSELQTEALASLGLAVPLVVAQLAETGILVVNSVMMGLLGTQNLAAGALGTVTFITLLSICVGILTAGGALAAEAKGAKNIDILSRITCQGLWLAAAISLPAMFLLWNCDSIALLFGQEKSNILLTTSYLHAIVWGLPAAVGFFYLKEIAVAINFTQFGTVIIVAFLLLSVPVNYVLMFGLLGFPILGLAGIGWGTTLIYWVSFLASVIMIHFHPNAKDYKLFQYLYQFNKEVLVKIFLNGWPTGVQLGMQLGMFTITALFMGNLGTAVLAGHEIAIETSDIFMISAAAISYTTASRVGQMMGEKNREGIIRAAYVNVAFSILFTLVVAICFDLFAERIVAIYLDINDPNNTEAISQAINFLKLAGVYQIFYSTQAIWCGALQGLQDTRIPMLINILIFWGVGLGGGYLMAITLGWEGIGFWYGLILAPAISSVVLMIRFYQVHSNKIVDASLSSTQA